MYAKYLIILNKSSNHGKTKKNWPQIKEELDKQGFNYIVYSTKYSQHAISIANYFANIANNNNVILVIGGDGTLNETINGIKNNKNNSKNIPISFIPTGVNNHFAKAYNISLNWIESIQQIKQCKKIRTINIGYYKDNIKKQEKYFINEAGIGLDAEYINKLSYNNKWHHLKLLFNIIDISYNLQTFPVIIYNQNKRYMYKNALIVNISNHSDLGKKKKFYPYSQKNDNNLDVVIIEKHNTLINIYMLIKFILNKKIKNKSIHFLHQSKLHLIIPSLEFGQIDNENIGSKYYDNYYSIINYPFYF